MKKLIGQLFKFGVVGGSAFLIDYFLLLFLTEVINIDWFYSSIISFSVSLLFNYILSIKWVFDVDKKQTPVEIIVFVVLSVIGLGINQACMVLFTDYLAIDYRISKIIATFIVMIWNFITRKVFLEKINK